MSFEAGQIEVFDGRRFAYLTATPDPERAQLVLRITGRPEVIGAIDTMRFHGARLVREEAKRIWLAWRQPPAAQPAPYAGALGME